MFSTVCPPTIVSLPETAMMVSEPPPPSKTSSPSPPVRESSPLPPWISTSPSVAVLPGESVTITYDVFVGFATDVLTGVTNIANVEGTSTPDATNPFNRVSDTSDDAVIIADPIPVV